jgi:multidrug efflux pump subunit AcrA (membrane-fusion protein)
MKGRGGVLALGVCLLGGSVGWGQALPTAATIESIPLEPTMPERYHVTAVLEPVRRVSLVAPADGMIRSLEAPLGLIVRANQEIAQLDRADALARLKMARAEVKEKEALVQSQVAAAVSAAQLEAAQGRAELAQLELDRLTLRAPFAGRVVAVPVSSGQYVLKGTVIAELADVSSFKALVPVDRRTAAEGTSLKVFVEEQEQAAKVQSILPLPESYASLRSLAAPFAAAWIVVPNAKSDLAAGMRIRSETLPITPIATVPRDSVKTSERSGASPAATIQVIRNEYVTNVPVTVLGKVSAERIQITGPIRSTDALIVSSSVPLLAGTLVRFSTAPAQGVEGTTPSPERRGDEAGIVPPTGPGTAAGPGTTRPRPAVSTPGRPPRRPPAAPAQNATPF